MDILLSRDVAVLQFQCCKKPVTTQINRHFHTYNLAMFAHKTFLGLFRVSKANLQTPDLVQLLYQLTFYVNLLLVFYPANFRRELCIMTAAISTQTPFFNNMPPFLRVCLLSTPIKMGEKNLFLLEVFVLTTFFF